MNHAEYLKIREEILHIAKVISEAKRPLYTLEDKDVLSNFKTSASFVGCTPLQAGAIFLKKQIDSIGTLSRPNPPVDPEGFESRCADAINYIILMYCLWKEKEDDDNDAIR